jgi:cell fate (sporulation/competence/biofilm development) regulator YlbF (YheA/YmcA/DUF963 family)
MDQKMLRDHWILAERHAAQGQRAVAKQREILARLEADGHIEQAAKARRLLTEFEELQVMYLADRDKLRKALGL